MIKGDESTFKTYVKDHLSWSDSNFLCLKVSMTKEMGDWFAEECLLVFVIKGEQVYIVQYKYLGTALDDKLDLTENSATLLKRANQGLFFLKKLKSFKVNPEFLALFYHTTIESIITYNSLCFYGSLKKTNTAKLSRVTRTASKLIGSVVVDLQPHFKWKGTAEIEGNPS